MSKNKLVIPQADQTNFYTYNDYLTRLQNIAVNVFEWKNLPGSIDSRFLELTLFSSGMAVFYFEDVVRIFVALTTQIGGRLNVYNIPRERVAYATNGYNYRLNDTNSVLIFNNYLHRPDWPTLELFAQRLYLVDRAMMNNISQQRFPFIFKVPEGQRLTFKNLISKWDGNEPFIFGTPSLDLTSIETVTTGVPFVADKLMTLKQQLWNDALQFLGIETVNTDKPAHLITDEVSANLGYAHIQRFTRLNARRQACEQINQMFGLDIWVDFKSDINAVYNQTTEATTAIEDERTVRERERLYDPS